MELGAVHRLSDGDHATIPSYHCIPGHLLAQSESGSTPGVEGKHSVPVEYTLRACGEYLTVNRREETAEHRAQTYRILVLRGKLRTAARWITKRETGGVLQPGYWCTKTGDQAMEVLRTKPPGGQYTDSGESGLVT